MWHAAVIHTPVPSLPCIILTLNNSIWTGMINLFIMDVGGCKLAISWVWRVAYAFDHSGTGLAAHQELFAL